MENENEKRYTLATRAVGLESLIVTGVFTILMIIGACLISDKRFLFIPLLFLAVSFVAFIALLFRYFTEPKIAIQADYNGIYFYYRNNKEIFIAFKDIVEILPCKSRNSYGEIAVYTNDNKYKSIMIKEDKGLLVSRLRDLLDKENKEEYLIKIEII